MDIRNPVVIVAALYHYIEGCRRRPSRNLPAAVCQPPVLDRFPYRLNGVAITVSYCLFFYFGRFFSDDVIGCVVIAIVVSFS